MLIPRVGVGVPGGFAGQEDVAVVGKPCGPVRSEDAQDRRRQQPEDDKQDD